MIKPKEATVTFGDGIVTIERRGETQLTVAKVLGTTVEDGFVCTYLDRLVHADYESELGEFAVDGAISSRLKNSVGTTAPVAA